MLEAVARVLVWLGLGEILMRLGLVPVPGPVSGLVLLYLDLLRRGHLPEDLGRLADRMLALFGLLFVPAGVGVIAHADVLRAELVPVLAAVIGGTVVTLLATVATLALSHRWVRRGRTDGDRIEEADARA
ncbi:CidA/LrgA family protein [Methylobacterium sp. NEAU 140]|uniref:CidA/LrgA family protein n=1 Tax=Methylobacterium sp. NEAU 140 TaxID=3064945 RepID=UPI002736372C|nr:CidA/LrgA family protein [Methylobacterium sp. NEAU 140]MDP4027107.1 CidA/LrgA family protein [Methylobacterium sp. NEAU 140]